MGSLRSRGLPRWSIGALALACVAVIAGTAAAQFSPWHKIVPPGPPIPHPNAWGVAGTEKCNAATGLCEEGTTLCYQDTLDSDGDGVIDQVRCKNRGGSGW